MKFWESSISSFQMSIHPSQDDLSVVIAPYEKNRDEETISRILNDNAYYLRYEDLGFIPEGVTIEFINSPRFTTKVMQKDGKMVGFINYRKVEKKFLSLNFGSLGQIHLLGIEKEYQGKGYGKLLLVHALRDLLDQGASSIFLFTKFTNNRARALYEKLGFRNRMRFRDDCLYMVNYVNPKAPTPTTEEKILNYSLSHPVKSVLALTASAYATYKAVQWGIAQ